MEGPEAQHSLPFRKPGRQPGWQVVLYRFDVESVSRNCLERNEKAYCRTKRLEILVEMFCTQKGCKYVRDRVTLVTIPRSSDESSHYIIKNDESQP